MSASGSVFVSVEALGHVNLVINAMENNYTRILNATIELMGERSFHGTSVQMIADKVNVTKSTIFHYFKNKEGILLALFEDFVPPAPEAVLPSIDEPLLTKFGSIFLGLENRGILT
ncbi:MAG: helix-turn-helix transcriptional regulator [Deltaproteobacteria bacterium]|nr:helix-turn-helix transcriptional regulator [Deltaproteobacteria bacterium]